MRSNVNQCEVFYQRFPKLIEMSQYLSRERIKLESTIVFVTRLDLDTDYCAVNIKCHAPIRNIRIESILFTDKGDYTRSLAGTDGTTNIKVPKVKPGVSFSEGIA